MTFTAMRPEVGFPKGREVSLWSVSPGFLVDFGFEGRPEGFVRVVGAEEIGMVHKEALLFLQAGGWCWFAWRVIDRREADALDAIIAACPESSPDTRPAPARIAQRRINHEPCGVNSGR